MARKNVEPTVAGAGFIADVWTRVTRRARKLGLTHEELHVIVTDDGEPLIEEMAQAFTDILRRAAKKIGKIFKITVGGSITTEEVLARTTHTYVNPNVTSANFPLAAKPEKERTLEVIDGADFDHEPTSEEVIEEARRRGLTRPTHEDAFRFDEQYPNEKGWFVFLHELWQGPNGGPRVLCLFRGEVHHLVNLLLFVNRWDRDRRFVFVRES